MNPYIHYDVDTCSDSSCNEELTPSTILRNLTRRRRGLRDDCACLPSTNPTDYADGDDSDDSEYIDDELDDGGGGAPPPPVTPPVTPPPPAPEMWGNYNDQPLIDGLEPYELVPRNLLGTYSASTPFNDLNLYRLPQMTTNMIFATNVVVPDLVLTPTQEQWILSTFMDPVFGAGIPPNPIPFTGMTPIKFEITFPVMDLGLNALIMIMPNAPRNVFGDLAIDDYINSAGTVWNDPPVQFGRSRLSLADFEVLDQDGLLTWDHSDLANLPPGFPDAPLINLQRDVEIVGTGPGTKHVNITWGQWAVAQYLTVPPTNVPFTAQESQGFYFGRNSTQVNLYIIPDECETIWKIAFRKSNTPL